MKGKSKIVERKVEVYLAGRGKVVKKLRVNAEVVNKGKKLLKDWKKAFDELAKY